MSSSSETFNNHERSMRMNAPCSECGSAVPARRKGTCSAPCKKEAKRRYDRERHVANRDANIERVRVWQQANSERKREYDSGRRSAARAARATSPRLDKWTKMHLVLKESALRARKAGAPTFAVTIRDMNRALERAGHRCVYCRTPFSTTSLEWDHVIPISRGGHHSAGNLTPSCRPCNRSKMSRLIAEWKASHV